MKFLFFMTLLTLAACSPDNLPKYVELKGLRILGLIASSPEVDAGGSTTITPIVSDITETTSLTYEAIGCIAITSVDTTCSGNPTATALQSGTLSTGDMTAAKGFTGAGTAINVTVPNSTLIFSSRSSQDQFNGVSYLVTYEIRNSSGSRVQSFKRIIVSNRPSGEKNQNPTLTDIAANGSALTTILPMGQSLQITPTLGAPGAESYRVRLEDGTDSSRTEELVTTWFVTDGTLKYYRSVSADANTYETPGSAPARDAYLLALTRDGRGGLAYVRKCFGVCP